MKRKFKRKEGRKRTTDDLICTKKKETKTNCYEEKKQMWGGRDWGMISR